MKIYLDLLPPQIKKELQRKKFFSKILRQQILFLLPLIIFILILLIIVSTLLERKNLIVKQGLTTEFQKSSEEIKNLENIFKEANGKIDKFSKIKNSQFYWENLFQELSALTPEGITISNLATKNYQVFLLGKAQEREILLDFKEKLENSPCFSTINIPLANLVMKEKIDFQLDFKFKENCLQQKNV